MGAIYWKELRDHFASWRFLAFIVLVWLVSFFAIYTASETIIDNVATYPTESVFLRLFITTGEGLRSFLWFVGFLGPIIGIVFGFDAVNTERSRGTLSRILSQPIYRDSVINGKFLASFTVIAVMLAAIMLWVGGLGLAQIGVAPSAGEIARLVCFYLLSVLYVGFWLALGILFSTLFRRPIISALVPLAIWLFFAVFMTMIAGTIADRQEPINSDSQPDAILAHESLQRKAERFSPVDLYQEASRFVLDPEQRSQNVVFVDEWVESSAFGTSSVSLRQSMAFVWPHFIVLVGLIGICFAASYIKFVKEEIRAT